MIKYSNVKSRWGKKTIKEKDACMIQWRNKEGRRWKKNKKRIIKERNGKRKKDYKEEKSKTYKRKGNILIWRRTVKQEKLTIIWKAKRKI